MDNKKFEIGTGHIDIQEKTEKPDYYELRVYFQPGEQSRLLRTNHKRHGTALRAAKNWAKSSTVEKVRILWIKYKMDMPFVIKYEFIKGDRKN